MIKKIFGYSVITASVISGCYAFASPWLALRDLTKAFENQDTRKIAKLIDFPELREDIKVTAKAAMMKSAAIELDGNPFAAMGIMMANAIVDPIIDQVISPAGLQVLLSTGEISIVPSDILNEKKLWPSKESTTEDFKPSPDLTLKMNYTNLNEFKIELSNKSVIAEPISLFLEREGFADWKVTGIDIPQSIFNSTY